MTNRRLTNGQMKAFFKEDCPQGDITTKAIFGVKPQMAKATIIAKEAGVLSGIKATKEFLGANHFALKMTLNKKDGDPLNVGDEVLTIKGPVQDILRFERVALNIMQRMSGVASMTQKFVALADPLGVSILDTRKTTPGLRVLEKQAVVHGGGQNHRFSLSDQYLIKENHIAQAGSITLALTKCFAHRKKLPDKPRVEIEVRNLKELKEALAGAPHIILLDNMSPSQIKMAVSLRNKTSRDVLLEVSGGVTLKTLPKYVGLGIDRISVGALTHSYKSLDLSLLMEGA